MKIKVAETSGFCFGVQRAVDETLKVTENFEGPVFTWGPVVHNESVIQNLQSRGVQVLTDEKELEDTERLAGGTIIIRAHGITKKLEEKLRSLPVQVVDATCPFVKKIHLAVEKHSSLGEEILICGDPTHPEVQGIIGWCKGTYQVIQTEEDARNYHILSKNNVFMVVQTTFDHKKFQKMVEIIEEKGYNLTKLDTVCLSTHERQEEARKLAREVDLMLVIGSKSSSNSQKLYEICRQSCERTYFVQNEMDLKEEWFVGVEYVGITAGASTPKNIIQEVQNYGRKF